MPQSYAQYAANGSNRSFAVPFLYINKSHVRAKVDGVPVTFTWSGDSFIQLDAAPATGTVVEVRRTTPSDSRLVDFVDGSTLTERDLDQSNQQFLFLAQEAQDRADEAPRLTAQNTYDFQGRRATNLADPVAAQDAVTKTWVESDVNSSVARSRANADEALNAAKAAATFRDAAGGFALDASNHRNAAEFAAANPNLSAALLKAQNLADVTDKSAARGNLGLKTAALREVGVPGGVASYDDPRFTNAPGTSDPVYDRKATGGHSRTFTQIAADSVNILEWLSDAQLTGTADAGPALNACMAYCRSSGRTTAHVPSFPGFVLINTPVNYQGVHISGPGRGGVSEARFVTTADIDTFFSNGPSTGLSGIRLDHQGNGLFVALPRSLNHIVYDNMFYATNAAGEVSTATKAMIGFGGSNVFLRNNFFTNLRSNAYTIEVVRSTDDVCINTSILGNYFGGTGKGILVAANGNYDSKPPAGLSIGSPRARPEGLEISSNQSILTGGAFVEICSILNCRILNNMIDQSPTQGGIIFVPQGSQDYLGIYGVLILGNYISTAQDTTNGIGICHFTGAGNYCRGITIVGNEICFCGEGAYFGANSGQVTFSGNLFHSIAKGTAVRTDSAATARQMVFSRDNIFDQYGLKVNEANVNGQWRSTFSITTNTGDGNWAANAFSGRRRYILIPHLLAFAPAADTIQLQCRTGTDAAETIQAHVLSIDNTHVTVKVNVFGLAADCDVTIAMKCAINGPNS